MRLFRESRMPVDRRLISSAAALLGVMMLVCSGCSSTNNKDDKKSVTSRKGMYRDDEADILQSHTDARQGLNLPPDQPGVANDGTGWTGYR